METIDKILLAIVVLCVVMIIMKFALPTGVLTEGVSLRFITEGLRNYVAPSVLPSLANNNVVQYGDQIALKHSVFNKYMGICANTGTNIWNVSLVDKDPVTGFTQYNTWLLLSIPPGTGGPIKFGDQISLRNIHYSDGKGNQLALSDSWDSNVPGFDAGGKNMIYNANCRVDGWSWFIKGGKIGSVVTYNTPIYLERKDTDPNVNDVRWVGADILPYIPTISTCPNNNVITYCPSNPRSPILNPSAIWYIQNAGQNVTFV